MLRVSSIILAFVCSGCLSFNWQRARAETSLTYEDLNRFELGASSLTECLAELGAPRLVWEYAGDGVALAYVWSDGESLGGSLSIPVWDDFGPSMNYTQAEGDAYGAVLFFDADWVLERWRFGRMRDFEAERRRRPTAPPEES